MTVTPPTGDEVGRACWAIDVNPEPWAIGELSVGRRKNGGAIYPRIGPNANLVVYQEAVRGALSAFEDIYVRPPYYELRFGFSRQLASYKHDDRTSTRNWSDCTNMQKATEDALQGVLIDNDRNVVKIESFLIAPQSSDTDSYLIIELRWGAQILEDGMDGGMRDALYDLRARNLAKIKTGPKLWVPE